MDGNRIQTRQRTRARSAIDQKKEVRQEHPNAMDDENSISGFPAMESARGPRSLRGKGQSHKSPRRLVVPSYMDFAESSPAINSNLSRLEEFARDIQSQGNNNINTPSVQNPDPINQTPVLDSPDRMNQSQQTGHPDPIVHNERNSRLEDLFAHFQSQSHLSQPESDDDLGEKIAHLEEMFTQFTDEQRQKQKELDARIARLENMFTTFMEKYMVSSSTTRKDVVNVSGRVSRLENLIINFLEQYYGVNTAPPATSSTPQHFQR